MTHKAVFESIRNGTQAIQNTDALAALDEEAIENHEDEWPGES